MKLTKLFTAAALAGTLLLAGCTSESIPEPKLNPEGIARQVKNAIHDEVELNELVEFANDTTSFATDTVVSDNKRPIVVQNLKVIVENDEYSEALASYNQRLRDGRNFAIRLLAIILPFTFLFLLVAGVLWFILRKTRERNRLIEEAIQNNYQLPDSFYENNSILPSKSHSITTGEDGMPVPPPTYRDRKLYESGLKWSMIGLGAFLAMFIWGGIDAAAICLIPLFIGIGKLVTYYK